MAYPYYNPVNYNPNFNPNYYTPTHTVNGIVWVQGETGAKAYPVLPNTTVLLMDSEAQRFYLKSADVSGVPSPLRVFEYNEIANMTQNKGAEATEAPKDDKYITREEFERIIADFARKEDTPRKAKGTVKDDE